MPMSIYLILHPSVMSFNDQLAATIPQLEMLKGCAFHRDNGDVAVAEKKIAVLQKLIAKYGGQRPREIIQAEIDHYRKSLDGDTTRLNWLRDNGYSHGREITTTDYFRNKINDLQHELYLSTLENGGQI